MAFMGRRRSEPLMDFGNGRNLWERAAAPWPQQGVGGAADAAGNGKEETREEETGGGRRLIADS